MAASVASPVPCAINLDIALNRRRREFSERDRLLLNLLRPHLVQAYANAEAVTRMQREGALLQQTAEGGGQGVVVLTRDGRVRRISWQARAWLTDYFGSPSQSADRLPESLRAWITHQEAQLRRADDAPPSRTPLVAERDGARLAIRHLCEADQCLLLLEEQPISIRPAAAVEASGLTRREAEVLDWVAHGKTNAEIGLILEISAETVKKHLQHIFEKLGVETRTAAAALVLGLPSSV